MKAIRVAAGFALMLALAGCGGSDEAAPHALKMPDVVNKQLDIALSDIELAGIEDEPEILGGGTFGVIDESNWTVCDQSPAAGEDVTAVPELTVDRSCGDDATDAAAPTTESTVASTEPPTTAPAETLTEATSAEFAGILSEDYCSDAVETFASTNGGRTIEFDGHIAALANHGNNNTRFDILVAVGDFAGSTGAGPAFQFRDVNIVSDLGLTGPNIPDSLKEGDHVHIVAKVGTYESPSCLFLLEPVSTSMR